MATGIVKGATIVGLAEQGTAATGTIQITNNTLDAGDSVSINGVAFVETTDFAVGGSAIITAGNLASAINASIHPDIYDQVTASNGGTDTVTITAVKKGLAGNSITLAESDAPTGNFTLSGATLSGGSNDETTAVAPTSASSYVQVLEDGLEVSPAKELVERNILTTSIGNVTPRASTKSVSGSLPVEFRAQGVEGGIPQFNLPMLSALGARTRIRNRITTGSGHTTSNLVIADADKKIKKWDMLVILESGNHHVCFATAVASGSVTIFPVAPFTPSNGVELAKTVSYKPANSGHSVYTANVYWGNEIREQAIGARSASLSLENLTTGQIVTQNYGFEGLTFDRVDGVAPHSPTYDAGLPPLALCASAYVDGTEVLVNEVSVSLENTIGFLTSITSCDGRISGRVTERVVSGSLNPYMDDTSVANFTKFKNNTTFSLVVVLANESGVAGEYELGSICAFYLPSCLITEIPVADQEGVLTDAISFQASRGSDGLTEEMIIGFC